MKKRSILIIVTLVSVFLLGGAFACRHGFHPGGFDKFDQEAVTNRIASRLDLSDSQKGELKEAITEITARVKEMHADREARLQELADLVRQQTIPRETVDRMIAEKSDRMKELADFAAQRIIAFHATLTPEQREKIAEHIEEHAAIHRCSFWR